DAATHDLVVVEQEHRDGHRDSSAGAVETVIRGPAHRTSRTVHEGLPHRGGGPKPTGSTAESGRRAVAAGCVSSASRARSGARPRAGAPPRRAYAAPRAHRGPPPDGRGTTP